MTSSTKRKTLLLVEDDAENAKVASDSLTATINTYAPNLDVAMKLLPDADYVITDLFFPSGFKKDDVDLVHGHIALERIRDGTALKYAAELERKLEEKGIKCDEGLRKCFRTLGLSESFCGEHSQEPMMRSISTYASAFKDETSARLEQVLEDMDVNKRVERDIKELFCPLEVYMKQSPLNQPLGYLVAEEAERLGKPFVLATSLRHSNEVLVPVVKSVKARGWQMLEGAHGEKTDPKYWKIAYEILTAKTKQEVQE